MIIEDTLKSTIIDFCNEFVDNPYLCYTEHGQHARFYTLLYNKLSENERYIKCGSYKVCVIQKEYPTADSLGKPKRQHWDIAIIDSNKVNLNAQSVKYDYMYLNSVVEFGLNETKNHLIDDVERLSHPKANVANKFIVHLYRISGEGNDKISQRDWSPNSKRLISPEEIFIYVKETDVEVYLGVFDCTGKYPTGIWNINKLGVTKIR